MSALAGHSVLSHLGHVRDLPRGVSACRCVVTDAPSVVEVSTWAENPDYFGRATTPYGDQAAPFLYVPKTPTPDFQHRYLFRLCSVYVPWLGTFRLKGLRQNIVLATDVENDDGSISTITHQTTDPFFRYPDGDVSWHLQFYPGELRIENPLILAESRVSNVTRDVYGQGSALLYNTMIPYEPPWAGIPQGIGIASLGAFTDVRFPWQDHSATDDLNLDLDGPGTLVFYASCGQNDPRAPLPALTPEQFAQIGPDEQFVRAFRPQFRYLGGAITGEIIRRNIPWRCP